MSKIDVLKEEGNKYFKNEEYLKAIKCYKDGLEIEPRNSTLNSNLSQAYLAMGDFVEAEVHAVVTLAQQTDSVKPFYRASKAALGMMKRDRALMYLKAGLKYCPKAEELRTFLEEISKENMDVSVNKTSEIKTKVPSEAKNDSSKKELTRNGKIGSGHDDASLLNNSSALKNKVRSRSTSNNRGNVKASKSVIPTVSSVNKSSSISSKNGTAVKPEPDKFIETLLKIKSQLTPEEKDALLKRREAMIQVHQKLETLMKDGSEALISGLARQASEKYKTAIEIITENGIENFSLGEIDFIVLKYSLCMSWIQTLTYNNIIQSITYLTDIESNHSAKLPAVYYGLGNAFYRLNRFKTALQHLDKGVQIIDKDFKITPHPWPGTMQTIVETTKVGLKESLSNLMKECKTYREPDAICRYKKCLTTSTHINPSKIIFYSDPDFVGYVVIICEENCKITYHISCWKHYKDSISAVGKLSDKDMLGHACLTSDCLFEGRRQSVIVCIEVYGEDGKKKSTCLKEPTKTDNVNEHRKEKKKKNEKIERVVKIKPIRRKVKKIVPQTQKAVVKKVKSRSITNEFHVCLRRLVDMRSINFGFVESLQWNPMKDYFGRDEVQNMKTFLPDSSVDSESLKQTKDFIFTYFYEYLNDEGPQKFSLLDRKWTEEVSQFPGIDFISKHDGICDFLLQSYRFASIDDNLCLSHQIASVYHNVQIEMEQSASFILTCSSRSLEDELAIKKCLMGDDNYPYEIELHSSQDEHNIPSTSFSQTDLFKQSNYFSPYNPSPEAHFSNENSDCDSQIDIEDFMYECSSDEMDGLLDTDSEDNNATTEIQNYDPNLRNANLSIINENTNKHISKDSNKVLVNGSNVVINSLHNQFESLQIEGSENVGGGNINTLEEMCSSKVKLPIVYNIETQTEPHQDLAQEVEALKNENLRLKLQIQIVNDDKRNIISDFQKKMDEYQVKIQELEVKMSKGITEKDKAFNNHQQELEKRDMKYDLMMKKHKEEIESLKKKKEDDSILLKKTLESMNELNKEDDKKAIVIDRLEGQLRRANEHILNLRKAFGELKLDFYISKCTERLDFMNFMMKYMLHMPFSKLSEMKNAVDAWQTVAGELQDTRDFLQIQYDILAQQLKTKVSADCLLQLELAELPKEPPYPLEDFNNIVFIIQKFVQNSKVGDQKSFPSRHDLPIGNNAPSLVRAFPESSNNSNFMMGASSFFSDPSPSTVNRQFIPPNVNETGNNSFLRPWKNPLSDSPIMTSDTGISGTIVNANFPIRLPENQHLKPFQMSAESQSIGNLESGASAKQISGMKKMVPLGDNKNIAFVEERKISSVAGLTPIDKSLSTDLNDNVGHTSKLTPFELKKVPVSLKIWNYERLMEESMKHFKKHNEVEIGECLTVVREKNGNKLSGLTIATIMRRVEKVLEEKCGKTSGSMGMDKFGGPAWGEVKDKNVNWVNDDVDNECIICHMGMETNSVTSLQCKHTFHTECVRKWLHTSSTCPICRKYTCLADEFPPLS